MSNYRAIGHSQEFSMFPVENNSDSRYLKEIETRAGKWKILTRGGVFGPNASGKSTFISSIEFAKNCVVFGQRSGVGTGIEQFKGDFEDLNGISHFQFMIYINGEVFDYGFSMDKYQIHEEWLSQLYEEGIKDLYTRRTQSNGKTEIDIETKFGRSSSKDRELAEILKNSIQVDQKNQLFLNKLYENGITRVKPVFEWFNNLQVIFPESSIQALPLRMREDAELRRYIAQTLNKMDTGINDLSVVDTEIDIYAFAEKYNLPTELVQDIISTKNGILKAMGKYFIFSENKDKHIVLVQIKLSHNLNNQNVELNIEDESDGTRRLLDLLPMIFSIGKSNALFFVDEIDRSLHTKLTKFLLKEFGQKLDEVTNQIIITAHDVNLINLHDCRHDEIWFIEKNSSGEAILKPMSDFNIRDGEDTIKSYLNGRFGAVPVIRGDLNA